VFVCRLYVCDVCRQRVVCVLCMLVLCLFAFESTNQGHFYACVRVEYVQTYADEVAQNLEIISKALPECCP